MLDFYHRRKQLVDTILFIALITFSVYAFFTVLFDYVGPFFIGLLIALVLNPLVNLAVKRLRLKRWLASLLCLLFFIAAMSSLGVWVVSVVVGQAVSFFETVDMGLQEMLEVADEWLEDMSELLPEGWYIPDIQGMAMAAGAAFVGGGMALQAIGFVGNVPYFLVNLILALVSAYFFMADRERIFGAMQKAVPNWVVGQWSITKAGLSRAISGYFKAQAILMVMVGAISVIGLAILGNQFALLLGLLLAVLDFIPMLGPALVLLPWALFSFLTDNIRQGIGLLVISGVITVARQVLQPKIMGTQMGVHPLAFLVSMFIGFQVFGIIGFIVGPSLLVIVKAVKEANQDALHKDS